MRRACLLAVLLAACSFSSPEVAPGDEPPVDGGGSGSDAPPPCIGDGDDDGDTVCNAADKCPGQDDRADVDADGSPDGCDDWPCGMKPEDPGGNMIDGDLGSGRGWGANDIQIGTMRRLAVAPGAAFAARFDWWVLLNCAGSTCPAQIELGYGSTRSGCIFEGTVDDFDRHDGRFDMQLAAPLMPGVHELRINAGRNAACGDGESWYGGDPGADSTIAVLCVR